MTITAIRTACNRSEINGTTEFSDGTKMYWTEGPAQDTIYKAADGTITRINQLDDNTIYNNAINDGNEMGTMEMATREEEIEYEMIARNLSREEAERNINELDAELN